MSTHRRKKGSRLQVWKVLATATNTSPSPTAAAANRASSAVDPSLAIATKSADNNNHQLAVATTINPPAKRSTEDHTKVDGRGRKINGKEPLQTEAEVGEDGKLHVTVRKSTSSRSEIYSRRSHGPDSGVSLTPRPSNL
ncbi:hypothetical protein Vadar_017957 [Vaccinium darrowii]|uniref:Uncharacterized protein n=1 Tax=Vaccinium darrowii TaxID=229202 RepID=A0ACB7YNT6_9ERIC|nr:hypothetical protein Vadar_017957 [Vaccinium darrowii]